MSSLRQAALPSRAKTATEIRDAARKLAGVLGSRLAPPRFKEQRGNPLTPSDAFCNIVGTSSVFNHMKAEPEFHAEWLRDESHDATATDPGIIYPGCLVPTLSWKQGMGFGTRDLFAVFRFPDSPFSFFLKKESNT